MWHFVDPPPLPSRVSHITWTAPYARLHSAVVTTFVKSTSFVTRAKCLPFFSSFIRFGELSYNELSSSQHIETNSIILANMSLIKFLRISILKQTNKVANEEFILKCSACHAAVKGFSLQPQPFRGFSTSSKHDRTEDGQSNNFPQPYLPALMEFNEIRFQSYETQCCKITK